ncbi:uncharacterized protein LOC107814888 [Nicotiana tabacum]|uniref:Uncharacterized protein LOC107814888 n=1 Tax=Nicotiana tabacum TaxID=4097 RepID=A0A1S4C418_TOBAC|nr:uncharacterized protein LOC104103266 [Nicotiana tomentosiformis]
MSSAAADFHSPISSSVQSFNSNVNPNSSKFDAGFDCKPGSGRSRRKPRLVKMRKQSGTQNVDPKDLKFNRVNPVNNASFVFGATSKCDSTLNTNLDNFSAVYSANNSGFASNSGEEIGNEGFVFGAGKNYYSNLENLGFVFGANNNMSSLKFNFRSKNVDQINKNNLGSNSNVLNEAPACCESDSNIKSSLEFGQRKSSGNVGKPEVDQVKVKNLDNVSSSFIVNEFESATDSKLEQSESHKSEQSGSFHFGKFANGSTLQSDKLKANFVFGATRPNFDLGNGACNKDGADRGAESQGPKSTGTFAFGNGIEGKNKVSENTKLAEDVEDFNSEKTQNHNGFWSAQKSNLGADGKLKFASSSRNVVDTDLPKAPIFKLSDEMNSLNIGHSAQVNGAEKTNNMNEKSRVDIQNVFVFGLNQKTSNVSTESTARNPCDQPKDLNLKDHGSSCGVDKADTTDGEPNAKKACAPEIGESFASSLKEIKDKRMPGETVHTNAKFGLSSEQVNSFCFSAGTSGKENQPINFNTTTGTLNELLQNSLNSDMERDKIPFPLFTPEVFGSQHKVDTTEAPPGHQDEKKEEFSFPSTPFIPGTPVSDFSASNSNISFSFTANLFSGVNDKLGCGTSSRLRDKKVKKKKSLRQRTLAQQLAGQTDSSNEGSSKHNNESPGCCSPMDFSPYQDTNSSTSAEDVVAVKEAPVFNESEKKCGDGNEKFSGSDSGKDSDTRRDSSSYTSPLAQDGLSSIRHQYRKKYKLKVDSGSNNLNHRKVEFSSDAVQHSSSGRNCSVDIQSRVKSHVRSKGIHVSKADEDHGKLGLTDTDRESCEQWRIRGNQAYKAGNLLQAEDFYTKGIKSVSATEIPASCLEPLVLCYSNRAATRMSLRRMREAISDCSSAAALDSNFLKVKLRAANCYLVLGEVEEAMQYYNNCLESRINLCLDRRITIDAADGLQKAQKVSEHMHRCAEFLQQRTSDAAKNALGTIDEALSISCYSEKLLEMKGEAFCMLQMYNEVIDLCENTLDIAEKNFTSDFANLNDFNCKSSSMKFWRWRLMSMSYFHLGKFEVALNLIEKQEEVVSVGKRSGNMTQESSSALAATIRELLRCKKAGNEAFKSGKYTEAIDHYSAAITSGVESRPFTAICFCNRAAAHQALGQIVDAIADCSVAIALDKNYTKAVSRRATLHEMIRDYEHAVNDLERLISLQETQSQERTRQSETLDKSNGSSAKETKRTRRQLSSIQEKTKRGTPLDLYLILGIKSSDTESDIKKAYRKAALRHHPDKAGQILARNDAVDDGGLWKEISETVRTDADRLFKLIGEAYAVLSDSDKRSKHDLEEEMRDVQRDSTRSSDSCRPSDSYSSPFERTNWSRRQSNFYSSPFGRSSSKRYGQEYWRTYGESHPRW